MKALSEIICTTSKKSNAFQLKHAGILIDVNSNSPDIARIVQNAKHTME